MAGFFRWLYDWLLSLFWYVRLSVFLPWDRRTCGGAVIYRGTIVTLGFLLAVSYLIVLPNAI